MTLTNFIRVVAFAVCAATVSFAYAASVSGAGATFPYDLRQMGRHVPEADRLTIDQSSRAISHARSPALTDKRIMARSRA
jgi:hypothetical protein